MSVDSVRHGEVTVSPVSAPDCLLVAWQHPDSRLIAPVGLLEQWDDHYEFAYLRRASAVDGFQPFLGFPELGRRYRSSRMFPLFRQRVMDSRRPDYVRYLHTLGLQEDSPSDDAPMEILGRSSGWRLGDAIQLFPKPTVQADGRTACRFLVHGVSHQPGAGKRIALLARGDPLVLRDEPSNPKNPQAVLVAAADGQLLGWVPDLLLDYLAEVRLHGAPAVFVEHANREDVPPHLQLLASLEGRVTPGYEPFTGPGWETAAP